MDVRTLRRPLTAEASSRRAGAAMRVRRALRRVRTVRSAEGALHAGLTEVCATLGFGRAALSHLVDGHVVFDRVIVPRDPRAAARLLEQLSFAPIPLADLPHEAEAIRTRGSVLVATGDDSQIPDYIAAAAGRQGYVAAPLMCEGSVAGFLHADDGRASTPMTELDRECLWAFTEGLSYATECRVMLERERDRHAQVADLILAADRAVRAFGGVDTLPALSVVLERAEGPAVGVDRGHEPLTHREAQVIELMAAGETNRGIAEQLIISEGTVKSHAASILRKLGAHTRAEAVSKYVLGET